MLSSFKKSPVEQETIGCYSIFQVGSLSNIQFDLDFLNEEAMRCGFTRIENPTTDAMVLARKKLKRRSGVSLSRVADDLNIHYDIRHRAAPDCSLTYKVFEKLKKMGRDEFTDP